MEAKFQAIGKALAELENGKQIECTTLLRTYGDYEKYYEPAPVEYMYGWYEIEQDINESTIEAVYPNEYAINNNQIEAQEVKIKSIIKCIGEIDWKVIE